MAALLNLVGGVKVGCECVGVIVAPLSLDDQHNPIQTHPKVYVLLWKQLLFSVNSI